MEEFRLEEEKGMKHLARLEERGLKDLVRADGSYVRIESLRAEFVGLLFFSLVDLPPLLELREAYDRLRRANGDDLFQIVVVAVGKGEWEEDRGVFYSEFEHMPPQWLAIPFDDWLCRERLQKIHGYTNEHSELRILGNDEFGILNEKGRPSSSCVLSYFSEFGPAGFPFTAKQIDKLKSDRDKIVKSKSLKALLGTDSRDFVISITDEGQQTKVPISELEGKVIAVYTCRTVPFPSFDRDDEKLILNFLMESCGPNFKLLLINADHAGGFTDEAPFLTILNRLPGCLTLPFKDEKIWALTSMFSSCISWRCNGNMYPRIWFRSSCRVGIIGADGTIFLDGLNVILEYGKDAYPFTIDGAGNAAIKRLTGMKLQLFEVLDELGVHSFFKKEKVGQDVRMISYQISSLLKAPNGKNKVGQDVRMMSYEDLLKAPNRKKEKEGVVLYIDDKPDKRHLNRLMEWRDNFQVIFLSLDKSRFAEDFYSMPMSWFGFPIPGYYGSVEDFNKNPGFLFPGYYGFVEDFNKKPRFLFPGGGFVMVFGGPTGCLLKLARLKSFGCRSDNFPFITHEDFVQDVTAYLRKKLSK